MMSDPQELGSIGLLAIGVDPAKSTPDEWKAAADKLQAQKDAGIVRNYYDQSYINALKNGDTVISQAWSGDIFQANLSGYKNLKFVIPQEGAMLWTDNMCIPLYAAEPAGRHDVHGLRVRPRRRRRRSRTTTTTCARCRPRRRHPEE